jgi:hypothetical protein
MMNYLYHLEKGNVGEEPITVAEVVRREVVKRVITNNKANNLKLNCISNNIVFTKTLHFLTYLRL